MKVFFLSLIFVLCLTESCFQSYAYAVCTADQQIDLLPYGDVRDQLFAKFPFSILAFSVVILDELSAISPVSPTDLSIHVAGMDLTPLSWIDSNFTDTVATAMRIMILAILIFSVTKHVIERIL